MRIITGSKRGKKLVTLEGEQVRPTTDRVKESLFNILQFQLEGRKFLDLFAGSGQIGLEALSRGAALCVFVDSAKESIRVVEKNIQSTGLGEKQIPEMEPTVYPSPVWVSCGYAYESRIIAGRCSTSPFWTRPTAPGCWSRLCPWWPSG